MQTVTAYLSVDGAAAAIDFYSRAFGAKEQYRLLMGDGRIGHAEIVIGDTLLMLADEFPEMDILGPLQRGGTSASFTVEVDSVDALDRMWADAVAAGATVQSEPIDQFYGYRSGALVDPFGHRWGIQTKLENVSPEEMQRRMEAMGDGTS
ncbi:MAG: VOC family protein [Acidimicrobiia bacterium]|jgi:PhnB protein